MAKEKKKIPKKVKIIGNVIFFSVIAVIVTFSVWNFIDIRSGYKYPIFGLRNSVIVSPSMATVNEANTYITEDMKQIKPYDVVTTKQYGSFEDIKQYDIATYFAGSNKLICHRVVDKYVDDSGKQYIVFRGDANSTNDAPVSYDLIRGKVVGISRQTGHFIAFIQSPYLFIAIFGTIFFVALGMFIISHGKEKKELEAEEQSAQVPQEETNNEQPQEQVEETPQEEVKEEKQEEAHSEEPKEDESSSEDSNQESNEAEDASNDKEE